MPWKWPSCRCVSYLLWVLLLGMQLITTEHRVRNNRTWIWRRPPELLRAGFVLHGLQVSFTSSVSSTNTAAGTATAIISLSGQGDLDEIFDAINQGEDLTKLVKDILKADVRGIVGVVVRPRKLCQWFLTILTRTCSESGWMLVSPTGLVL